MGAEVPTEPSGPTGRLCEWISSVDLNSIPIEIQTRAKYLALDGFACALTGAHLPHSEIAANVIFSMESAGQSSIIGWSKKTSPLSAALLNGTFIQGFELDDWHTDAPVHSNSILIPALFAASQHKTGIQPETKVSGSDFLLSLIVGYEVNPRIGLALYGRHVLTEGWHSGAVFGPSASAAAVGKLLGLSSGLMEDSLGIACTQACGLMSAQFEPDVKRMQHGFAARNGLLGALLANGEYVGIKRVYEREYGGFLSQFSKGNGQQPPYKVEEICKELGLTWRTNGICIKPYAAMAGTHGTVDCVSHLQKENPHLFEKQNLKHIKSITIRLDEVMYNHGGWHATRPLTATGAQMSNAYVCATQLVDNTVLVAQFKATNLDRDDVWDIVNKTTCVLEEDYSDGVSQVEIIFENGTKLSHHVANQRGVDPPLSNDEILEKWRMLAKEVVDDERAKKIEDTVLNLDILEDITTLIELLDSSTRNPLA